MSGRDRCGMSFLAIWAVVGPLVGAGLGALGNHLLAGRRESLAHRRMLRAERARAMRKGLEALQSAVDRRAKIASDDLIALRAALHIFGDDVGRTAAGLLTLHRPEDWYRRLDSLLTAIRQRTEAEERDLGLEPVEVWSSYQKHLAVRRDAAAFNDAEFARFQASKAVQLEPLADVEAEHLKQLAAAADDDDPAGALPAPNEEDAGDQ